jgi:hypothetical protein
MDWSATQFLAPRACLCVAFPGTLMTWILLFSLASAASLYPSLSLRLTAASRASSMLATAVGTSLRLRALETFGSGGGASAAGSSFALGARDALNDDLHGLGGRQGGFFVGAARLRRRWRGLWNRRRALPDGGIGLLGLPCPVAWLCAPMLLDGFHVSARRRAPLLNNT